MARRVRAALLLVLVVAAVAVMLRLSLWQWHRARERGSWMNYSYAVEWVVFAVLTVAGVVRLVLEERHRTLSRPAPAAAGPVSPPGAGGPVPVVGPPLRPGEELEEVTWVRMCRRLGLGVGGS